MKGKKLSYTAWESGTGVFIHKIRCGIRVIWELPPNDDDYSRRWRMIKASFTKALVKQGCVLKQNKRGEYNLWQNRFWEHRIRDENDLQKHCDYIHYNPVKHGLVSNPTDWPHSSIHRFIANGILSEDWGGKTVDGSFGEL